MPVALWDLGRDGMGLVGSGRARVRVRVPSIRFNQVGSGWVGWAWEGMGEVYGRGAGESEALF